jgi:prevent-host-death family protein
VDILFIEVYTSSRKGGEWGMNISVKEARSQFSAILSQAEEGKEIVIMRRGKAIARLIPCTDKRPKLPSLKDLRASVKVAGEPLSRTVVQNRTEERY